MAEPGRVGAAVLGRRPGVAWPRLIYDTDEVVGFLMAFFRIDWTGDGTDFRSGLWRLNISGAAAAHA
ncbi:hypothetical protein GCM10010393_31500 [Streptomyces gobitricini]|uniref:GNAT family N-acetyltransferase n=1 Tax=Streptomyces gobitricini TaxID=68211 RepID=A0ABP5ZGG2_9ACTN